MKNTVEYGTQELLKFYNKCSLIANRWSNDRPYCMQLIVTCVDLLTPNTGYVRCPIINYRINLLCLIVSTHRVIEKELIILFDCESVSSPKSIQVFQISFCFCMIWTGALIVFKKFLANTLILVLEFSTYVSTFGITEWIIKDEFLICETVYSIYLLISF